MTLTPTQKAWISSGVTAFLGGAAGYLEPLVLQGSLPPQAQWGHVLLMAVGAGVVALYQRFKSAPSQDTAAKAVAP
jgi:hypothetical protein